MTDAEIVDLVKALVWPAVVVFGMWYWRDELRAAAKRIREIGLTGAKFAPPEQQVPAHPSSVGEASTLGKDKKPDEPLGTPNVAGFIGQLKSFISDDQLQPTAQKIRTDLIGVVGNDLSDQKEALIYYSASLSIQLSHEKNYNAIFGSQLTVLTQANGIGGIPPATAKLIYEQIAKPSNPTLYATYTFEAWIGFLINSGLLATDAAGNYVLTIYGRGFLKYMVDRQLTVFKPN